MLGVLTYGDMQSGSKLRWVQVAAIGHPVQRRAGAFPMADASIVIAK